MGKGRTDMNTAYGEGLTSCKGLSCPLLLPSKSFVLDKRMPLVQNVTQLCALLPVEAMLG